ncbi:MAG TPA: helix-turn-helix domain-containing protein [Rhodothermales bacterium]|nr:helix-turn-helix domain-containing protein [Rhodothermales bacterium]
MLTPDLDQLVFTAYPLLDATFARALARPEPLDHWVLIVVVALASAFLLLRLGSAVSRRNWKDSLLDQKREARRRTRQLAHIFSSRESSSPPTSTMAPTETAPAETFDLRTLDVQDRLNRARAEAIHVLMLIDRLLESTRTYDGMMKPDLSERALTATVGEAFGRFDAGDMLPHMLFDACSTDDEGESELPVLDDTGASGDTATAMEGDISRPLILVVTESAEVRSLVDTPRWSRYRIAESSSGHNGLQMARRLQPELIISNALVGGMEEVAFSRKVKADKDLQHIPIVLLAALDSPDARVEAIQAGVDAFVTQPFGDNEIAAVVDNLIKSRRALRQLYSRQVLLKPYDVVVASSDCSFVERVYEVVNQHLGDAGFTVGQLAREVGVSESRLKRKLRSLIDETPVALIRRTRLERAADLLRQGSGNVSDAAFATGFSNLSYFAKCFRKRWGLTPSQFLASETSAQRNGRASGQAWRQEWTQAPLRPPPEATQYTIVGSIGSARAVPRRNAPASDLEESSPNNTEASYGKPPRLTERY